MVQGGALSVPRVYWGIAQAGYKSGSDVYTLHSSYQLRVLFPHTKALAASAGEDKGRELLRRSLVWLSGLDSV